ncbi:MAG: hypothetical protein MdMp014T_1434 [Treponematales bacterium]
MTALLCAAAAAVTFSCGPASIIFGGSDSINLSSQLAVGVTGGGWTYEEDALGGMYIIHDNAVVAVTGASVLTDADFDEDASPRWKNMSRLVVEENAAAEMTLKDVTMNFSAVGTLYYSDSFPIPIDLRSGARLTLRLSGTNRLTVGAEAAMAAIHVPKTAALTIAGVDGGGMLTADGGYGCPGIGSNWSEDAGTITIQGGTVVATGGEPDGAGIGSASYGSGGEVTITGGTVIATGAQCGAGIGSGGVQNDYSGTITSGDITILGGVVQAVGGEAAAGIGGGYFTRAGNITITGGSGKATATRGIGFGTARPVGPGDAAGDGGAFNGVPDGWPEGRSDGSGNNVYTWEY